MTNILPMLIQTRSSTHMRMNSLQKTLKLSLKPRRLSVLLVDLDLRLEMLELRWAARVSCFGFIITALQYFVKHQEQHEMVTKMKILSSAPPPGRLWSGVLLCKVFRCVFGVPQVCAKVLSSLCQNIPARITFSDGRWGAAANHPLLDQGVLQDLSSGLLCQLQDLMLNLSWLYSSLRDKRRFMSARGNSCGSRQRLAFNGHWLLSELFSEFYLAQIWFLKESDYHPHLTLLHLNTVGGRSITAASLLNLTLII